MCLSFIMICSNLNPTPTCELCLGFCSTSVGSGVIKFPVAFPSVSVLGLTTLAQWGSSRRLSSSMRMCVCGYDEACRAGPRSRATQSRCSSGVKPRAWKLQWDKDTSQPFVKPQGWLISLCIKKKITCKLNWGETCSLSSVLQRARSL